MRIAMHASNVCLKLVRACTFLVTKEFQTQHRNVIFFTKLLIGHQGMLHTIGLDIITTLVSVHFSL